MLMSLDARDSGIKFQICVNIHDHSIDTFDPCVVILEMLMIQGFAAFTVVCAVYLTSHLYSASLC